MDKARLEALKEDVSVVLEEVTASGASTDQARWKKEDDNVLVLYLGRRTGGSPHTYNHTTHLFGLTLQGLWLRSHKVSGREVENV